MKKLSKFKFTGDKTYPLWNKGKGNMGLISAKDLTVKDFDKFWYLAEKNRVMEPIAAVYDKNLVKFWGMAKDNISQDQYFMSCNLTDPDKKVWTPCKKLEMQIVTSYEVNYSRDRMYLGGTKSSVAVLAVITLEDKMEIECSKKFVSINLASVSNLKRIEGTDTLLLSGLNSVMVLQYNKERKVLNTVHFFNNISDGEIESSLYFKNHLIVLSPLNGSLMGVKFPTELNQADINHAEYPASFAGGNEKVGVEQIQEKTNALQAEFQKLGGFNIDYFGGLLDNFIETTPKLLMENEDQTIENFKMASVFSLETKSSSMRIRIDDDFNKLYTASGDSLRQYEISGRSLKQIKGSTLKGRLI